MKLSYRVGELAKYFGVSTDTLRLYDKMGIISPRRDAENGYRYYSRADLICMAYVLHLREANLSLDEIRLMLNDSSVEKSEAIMQMQESLLDEKIEELMCLKSIVRDYRSSFGDVIENLGVIDVRQSPPFLCQHIHGSMIDVLDQFRTLTQRLVPRFTFVGDRQLVLSHGFLDLNRSKMQFTYAITMKDEENLGSRGHLPDGMQYIPPRRCVYSIAKTYTEVDYTSFGNVRQYILDHGLTLLGDMWFRVISMRHNTHRNTDYYEIWAPVE